MTSAWHTGIKSDCSQTVSWVWTGATWPSSPIVDASLRWQINWTYVNVYAEEFVGRKYIAAILWASAVQVNKHTLFRRWNMSLCRWTFYSVGLLNSRIRRVLTMCMASRINSVQWAKRMTLVLYRNNFVGSTICFVVLVWDALHVYIHTFNRLLWSELFTLRLIKNGNGHVTILENCQFTLNARRKG